MSGLNPMVLHSLGKVSGVLLVEVAVGVTSLTGTLALLGYYEVRCLFPALYWRHDTSWGTTGHDTSSPSWDTSLITSARQSLSINIGSLGSGWFSEPRSGEG